MRLAAAWRRLVDGPDPRGRLVAKGLVVGLLCSVCAGDLGLVLPYVGAWPQLLLHIAVATLALRGRPWLRRAYWAAAGALAALNVIVGFSPLAPRLLDRLEVDDGAQRADVIVVLSASTYDVYLTDQSQDRWAEGLRLWHQGVAPALVFTGQPGSEFNQFNTMGPELAAAIGVDSSGIVPFEAVRPGRMNTRGEAESIAAMAKTRGWRRVLLVTSPAHTRRSQLVFQRVGLVASVKSAPSSDFGRRRGLSTGNRKRIGQVLLYEGLGLVVYRLKGWI